MSKWSLEYWDETWDKYMAYTAFGEFDTLEDAKRTALIDNGNTPISWDHGIRRVTGYTNDDYHQYYLAETID